MDISRLTQLSDCQWRIEPSGDMRVPAIVYGDSELVGAMDDMVAQQIANVACLPGIVGAAHAMPDAHWGYGFPIGGVAAFDPDAGGVVSAGGVGFDISCGVRVLLTGLPKAALAPVQEQLADALFSNIPAGVGSTGALTLATIDMDRMLAGGARWAVEQGYGAADDLGFIEERGCVAGADPAAVSDRAKKRQHKEMGTLGSGNHYLEIQEVTQIHDPDIAAAFGLRAGDVVLAIHCGSRGLGHQIGTEFLREMAMAASVHGIVLPDRELACAPIKSELGQRYLGAMRAAINCALANRQILTHLARRTVAHYLPEASLELLFDVSHNTCKEEQHVVEVDQLGGLFLGDALDVLAEAALGDGPVRHGVIVFLAVARVFRAPPVAVGARVALEVEGLLRGLAAARVEDELRHAAGVADHLGLVGAHVVAHAVLRLAGRVALVERGAAILEAVEHGLVELGRVGDGNLRDER